VQRGGAAQVLKMDLPKGWRYATDNTDRSTAWSLRVMAAGGLNLVVIT
jgi:hypothetical protein